MGEQIKESLVVAWGGERVQEPGDMPLMPPFPDTRFWNDVLIGQMSSRWQMRSAVDSIALIQYHTPSEKSFFKTQILSNQ